MNSSTSGWLVLTRNFVAGSHPQNDTSYGFDSLGNLQRIQYPNGITNFYQYDALDRLTNLVWKLNTNTLGSFYYRLGLTGNRTNLSEAIGSAVSRAYAWSYDPLYRLTNETVTGSAPTGTLSYALDDVGNRTSRTGGLGALGAQTFGYSSNDWVTTDDYDSDGNTLWTTNGTAVGPYGYDYEDRLITFNGQVTNVYNADGQRIKKVAPSGTTLYLVDTLNPSGYPQVLEELTVTGGAKNLAIAYTYGRRLVSQRHPGSSTNFFGFDGHGSTIFLLDRAGAIGGTYAYDAYGTLIASNGTPATAYLYCAEQLDSDLGLYLLRARYLNTGTGRFSTGDVVQGSPTDPASLQRYTYVRANPANRIDPEGDQDTIEAATTESIQGMLEAVGTRAPVKAIKSCGVDVTVIVNQTVSDINSSYTALNPKSKRKKACSNILGRYNVASSYNWQVTWLVQLAPGWRGAECERTVTYAGKCYRDDALWYFLFGRAAALCKKDFPNSFGDPMDDLLNGLVDRSEGKIVPDSDAFIGNKVEVARHFYDGSPLTNQNPGCPCQTDKPKDAKVDPKDWYWPGVK